MPGNFTVSAATYLSNMMYSFRYGMKDKYYSSLERLKPFVDEDVYNWFYNFGMSVMWHRKGGNYAK